MQISGAGYHSQLAPNNLKKAADMVGAMITKYKADGGDFTHLVMTGTSGQSVGFPVAYNLGLQTLVVRKKEDEGHGGVFVGTKGELGDYVILDDFIGSGATIRYVVS